MPLPERFESYRGFVIRPYSVQSRATSLWTVACFIHPESNQAQEELLQDTKKNEKSYENAVEQSMQFGKQIIDKRLDSGT